MHFKARVGILVSSAILIAAQVQATEVQTKTIKCIAVQYSDTTDNFTEAKAASVCRQIRAYYDRNSRGLLKFKISYEALDTGLPKTRTAYLNAISQMKAKYPNLDMYIMLGFPANFSCKISTDRSHPISLMGST